MYGKRFNQPISINTESKLEKGQASQFMPEDFIEIARSFLLSVS